MHRLIERRAPAVGLGLILTFIVACVRLSHRGDVISVAVLPFIDLSSSNSRPSLGIAIAEDVRVRLGVLRHLDTIALSSIMPCMDDLRDAREVGHELGARYVVSGTIDISGNQVSLTATMGEVETGLEKWSWKEAFDKAELPVHLPPLSLGIARAARGPLSAFEARKISRNLTRSFDAWRLYTQGKVEWIRAGLKDLELAIKNLNEALRLDPGFTLPYVALAEIHADAAEFAGLGPAERQGEIAAAKNLLSKALELDRGVQESDIVLARIAREYDLNLPESERLARRALESAPSSPDALRGLGLVLAATGRFRDAVTSIRRAWALDPRSVVYLSDLCRVHCFMNDLDLSLAYGQQAISLASSFAPAYWNVGMTYLPKGLPVVAVDMLNCSLDLGGALRIAPGAVVLAQRRAGRPEVAGKLLYELDANYAKGSVGAYAQALARLGMEEPDRILDWLERAYQERESELVYLKVNPLFKGFRGHPRFEKLLNRMGIR